MRFGTGFMTTWSQTRQRIRRNYHRVRVLLVRFDEIMQMLETAQAIADVQPLIMHTVRATYPSVAKTEEGHSAINAHELKMCSQNGEDGILLYIFSVVGARDRRFVEIGVSDGRECNSANLALHFGWSGLQIEGSPPLAALARAYYEEQLGVRQDQVAVSCSFVTTESINATIESNNLTGQLDLLSIDVDGNDYWIWESITVIKPRVVVIEYNPVLGPRRSWTIPYDPGFNAKRVHSTGYYSGASLAALTHLASTKGYSLVGCCSDGVNAFYVRNDVVRDPLRAVSVEAAYYAMSDRWQRAIAVAGGIRADEDPFALIEHFPWVELN